MKKPLNESQLAFETAHVRALLQLLALTFAMLTTGYAAVHAIGESQFVSAKRAKAQGNDHKTHAMRMVAPTEKLSQP